MAKPWLGWGGPSTSPQYEEQVEKYCSPLNLPYPQSDDIATALEITDLIRSKTVQPKAAMQSLKRRITSQNGRTQMYAIALVDTCIKNGGDHFLREIASKEFVDAMSGVIKSPSTSAEVKTMAIKNFQSWAIAFESKRELSFLTDVYTELKNSGITFPPPPSATSSHLLTTTTAPAWVDSDVCMRCRTAFTMINRKHHCRNCGLVFDQQCSSKSAPLPLFGIMEPVRVCDSCYSKVAKKQPTGPAPAVPGRTPRSRQDLDADLQRAIELSLADSQPGGSSMMGSEPPLRRHGQGSAEDDDEELRLAIEASLRDVERERPSAPTGYDEPEYKPLPTFDLTPRETETVLTFSNTLDQMAAYGERDLRRFPHAHVLYEQAYAVGGKLQRNAEEKRTKQHMLAEMQDKLSQAVGLYGNILDGQQAFAARRMQEQQQRQYQYNQMPPQQYQPYAYDNRYASPAPQANGYPAYQPSHQYQPPPQPQAGPSLYPSIPQGQPTYTPQIYQPPQQQHSYQPQPQAQYQAPYANGQYATSPGAHSGLYRQQSQNARQPQEQSMPPQQQQQRQVSMPYVTEPQGYAVSPHPTGESSYATASAPPPVDLASHPSTSPQSTLSALPSAPPVASPPQTTSHMPQVHDAQSGVQQQPSSQQPYEHHPPQAQTQPTQTQAQVQSGQVYYPQSFPQAPAAVFPDAPSDEIDAEPIRKEEPKEALLIEL